MTNNVEVELVARMALTALVIGTVTAIMGTGRVTGALVLSGAVMWSFVPVLQLLTGMALVGVQMEPLRRYFATSHYWLLWLLAVGAVFVIAPDGGPDFLPLILTAILPCMFTALALRAVAPAARVVLHQLVTLALIAWYIAWAIGGWERLATEVGL